MARGGARPNAGRKKTQLKIADNIKNHCVDFMIELFKDENIKNKARKEFQKSFNFDTEIEEKEDFLYIIKSNNIYKIGYTKNIKSRINDYSVGLGLIEVVYVYKSFNCFELESYLHNMFIDKNIKGEWFELNDNDVLKIVKYCSLLIK